MGDAKKYNSIQSNKVFGIVEKNDIDTLVKDPLFSSLKCFGEENSIDFLKNIELMDSIHDFGDVRGSNLATDALVKQGAIFKGENMRISLIKQVSFGDPSFNIQSVSAFNYLPNFPPFQFCMNDLEDYYMIVAIKQHIASDVVRFKNDFKYIPLQKPVTAADTAANTAAILNFNYDTIATFFQEYNDDVGVDSTKKINFLVDTEGSMGGILQAGKDKDKFAYVIAQESVHDSASKMTMLAPESIRNRFKENVFIEVITRKDGGGSIHTNIDRPEFAKKKTDIVNISKRSYKSVIEDDDIDDNFQSNFNIQFRGMGYNSSVKKKEHFFTKVNYSDTRPRGEAVLSEEFVCKLNDKLTHPTNVPSIVRSVTALSKTLDIQITDDNTVIPVGLKEQKKPLSKTADDKKKYYELMNELYSNLKEKNALEITDKTKEHILDFNFTKKRAGDALQARIVKRINSGNIELPCYKMFKAGEAGMKNIGGNLDGNKIYYIKNIVLLTIDRVLFSYCIKHNIPAILAEPSYIILFNPKKGPALPALVLEPTVLEPTASETIMSGGEIITEIIDNDIEDYKVQKGGSADTDELINIFTQIPYCFYKLLPKILLSGIISGSNASEIADNITTNTDETSLFIVQGSNYNFLYDSSLNILNMDNLNANINKAIKFDKYIIITKNVIVYNSGTAAKPIYNIYKITPDPEDPNSNKVTMSKIVDSITIDVIKGIIGASSTTQPISVSNLRSSFKLFYDFFDEDTIGNIYDIDISGEIIYKYELDPVEEAPVEEVTRGGLGNSENDDVDDTSYHVEDMPILNHYLNIFYNKKIEVAKKENEKEVLARNILFLHSYFKLFDSYETFLCFDNEQYYQDFDKSNTRKMEVANNMQVNIIFKYLLDEFNKNKKKVCYGLLEHFFSKNEKYSSIYSQLRDKILYIFSGYINLEESVNDQIQKQIEREEIDIDSPIYKETDLYFDGLYDRVIKQTEKINIFLNSDKEIIDEDSEEYIRRYLGMYGFMNMVNDLKIEKSLEEIRMEEEEKYQKIDLDKLQPDANEEPIYIQPSTPPATPAPATATANAASRFEFPSGIGGKRKRKTKRKVKKSIKYIKKTIRKRKNRSKKRFTIRKRKAIRRRKYTRN